MIVLKSETELQKMRESGKILSAGMEAVLKNVRPGITTAELDSIAYETITKAGATPSFKNYRGFPASICTSVNEQVVHGIPGKRVLKEGDILSVDMGAYYCGYHSDMARTVGVGHISEELERLISVTRESFFRGLEQVVPGKRIQDVSRAVSECAEAAGYSVVTDLVGHGIGQSLHEPPDVPNFVSRSKGPALRKGMTIAIEPMINMGNAKVSWASDGWTVSAADGKPSAHYENTVAVTDGAPELLTILDF